MKTAYYNLCNLVDNSTSIKYYTGIVCYGGLLFCKILGIYAVFSIGNMTSSRGLLVTHAGQHVEFVNPLTAEFLTHFTVLLKNHYIKSATAYNS